MIDYIGWVGNLFLVAGLVLAGRKYRHAFLFTCVGEIIWTVEAFRVSRADLASLCIVFAVLSAWNWVLWGRSEKGAK